MNVTNAGARTDILSRPLNEKKQLLRSFYLKLNVVRLSLTISCVAYIKYIDRKQWMVLTAPVNFSLT